MTQAGKARTRAAVQLVSAAADDEQGGSRSVRRALEMFEFLLQKGEPATVGAIVAALQIPKSTAYELVRTLTEAGYLEPSGRGAGLFLGRKLFELGMAYRGQVDLLRDGSQIVEELRDATGETVQLSVLENDMMLVLLKEEGSRSIRIISRVGSRVPVNWAGGPGRLLVSDLDETHPRRLLKRSSAIAHRAFDHRRSETDPADPQVPQAGLRDELNETNEHAGCVLRPVIDAEAAALPPISVVAPEHRLGKQNRDELIRRVREASAKLSGRLGAH
jgi:DNA-binding IclR family transcriptional regulator